MYKRLDNLHRDLAKYLAFDAGKYSIEELFLDIKTFKDGFQVWNLICHCFYAFANSSVIVKYYALGALMWSMFIFQYIFAYVMHMHMSQFIVKVAC